MTEIFKLADFLESKKGEIGEPEAGDLLKLLKSDGRDLINGVLDFISAALVDITDGADVSEWHKITPHLEVFITINKRRKK